MRALFQCADNLSDIMPIENFDVSNVTNITYMFESTILEELKTPKSYPSNQNIKINLPQILYDENSNSYTKLDNTSPTNIWLKK